MVRLARAVAVIIAVTLMAQFVLELVPGSLAESILGEAATPAAVAQLNSQLGADRPFFVRYFDWLGRAITGDLGISPVNRQDVWASILKALPVTIELVVLSMVLALGFAIGLGLLCARAPGSRLDRTIGGMTSSALAVPAFVAGPVLVWLFAIQFGWFPVIGWSKLSNGLGDNLHGALLPAVCIALPEYAVFQRLLRADMIATLSEDYIDAARGRGIRDISILLKHALRPSSVPLITIAGLSAGRLLGGTVVVETLFNLPGLGRLLTTSILGRDLIVVQGIVVVIAIMFVLINLCVDLAYGFVDPRVRVRQT